MFFCAISGSPPTNPVVSKTSGTVYEKSLIERYIEDNGTDPITGEALTKEDLIDVKAKPSTLPPRPANQTSIPSMLTGLQAEFDAIMLESLEIKKQYANARQELANSLYREDAATRVIARLMKERDESREALTSLQKTMGFAPTSSGAQQEVQEESADVEMEAQGALPADVEAKIMETNQAKKRKPAAGYAKAADIKTYQQTSHVPSLHQTKLAGISALDLASDGKIVLTGGPDKTVQVFDLENSKVVAILKGHTKTVNHVAFRESTEGTLAISGGDKTVRVWGEDDGKWGAKTSFSHKKGEIAGFAVHPSGNFVSAASTDSTWSMYDLSESKEVATYSAVPGVDGGFAYTSFAVHPDGVLHGCGTKDGLVRVWDARQATSLAGSIESHSKSVSTLSFSENGYYLATGSSADPTVNIIDLRKLSILSSWTLPTENTVSEVRFDTSAQFLTVSGTDLRVYANKTWDELLKFEENAGVLSGARFGPLGQQIVVAGMDRALRVLGAKSE